MLTVEMLRIGVTRSGQLIIPCQGHSNAFKTVSILSLRLCCRRRDALQAPTPVNKDNTEICFQKDIFWLENTKIIKQETATQCLLNLQDFQLHTLWFYSSFNTWKVRERLQKLLTITLIRIKTVSAGSCQSSVFVQGKFRSS